MGLGNWFIEQTVPTRQALAAIDRLYNRFTNKATQSRIRPVILVLPSRESLIARIPPEHESKSATGYVYIAGEEKKHESFMPRASALIASVFFAREIAKRPWIEAIDLASTFTAEWVSKEAGRITERRWERNEIQLTLEHEDENVIWSPSSQQDRPRKLVASKFNWKFVEDEYHLAFNCWRRRESDGVGFGVIQRKDTYCLELWRAMSDVPGVISIERTRRNMLNRLSTEFERFVPGHRHSSNKSFLIVDNPGSGKSTLVKQLAKHRGLRVLSVNITELTQRSDLLGFFDTIVTTQALDPDVPILVFVDEINSLLGGHTVYSSFLAPLEDGRYNRDGKSFTIRPCIWLFVGTDPLERIGERRIATRSSAEDAWEQIIGDIDEMFDVKSTTGEHPEAQDTHRELDERLQADRAQKKSDFRSRLTRPPFVLNWPFAPPSEVGDIRSEMLSLKGDLDSPKTLEEILDANNTDRSPKNVALRQLRTRFLRGGQALERVYIGATMIKSMHPSIEKISLRVLAAFAYLFDDVTLRDLRHDLEGLVNVQRGRITWTNLPGRFRSRFGHKRLNDEGKLDRNDYCGPFELKELCDEDMDKIMVKIESSLPPGSDRWKGPVAEDTAG